MLEFDLRYVTEFPLKYAENKDVGEIVIWGLQMHKNRHFQSYQKHHHDTENHVHICALHHSG